MPDQAFIEELNRGYVCPPDAGPAWQLAARAGIDLSLIELSLPKTPWERWVEHDDALIRAKQAMSRTQDRLAVLQLQAIHERLSANPASGNRQM